MARRSARFGWVSRRSCGCRSARACCGSSRGLPCGPSSEGRGEVTTRPSPHQYLPPLPTERGHGSRDRRVLIRSARVSASIWSFMSSVVRWFSSRALLERRVYRGIEKKSSSWIYLIFKNENSQTRNLKSTIHIRNMKQIENCSRAASSSTAFPPPPP